MALFTELYDREGDAMLVNMESVSVIKPTKDERYCLVRWVDDTKTKIAMSYPEVARRILGYEP